MKSLAQNLHEELRRVYDLLDGERAEHAQLVIKLNRLCGRFEESGSIPAELLAEILADVQGGGQQR